MQILMVLTSHDRLGNTGRKAGFWLEEFAAPYFTILDAGAAVTVASPRGEAAARPGGQDVARRARPGGVDRPAAGGPRRWEQACRLRADPDAMPPPTGDPTPRPPERPDLPQIPGCEIEAVATRHA